MTASATRDLSPLNLSELDLVPFSVGDDANARGRIALPLSAESGAPCTVVYLEVDPGDRIPLHTHTAEETIVVLHGSGEATSGDLRADVSPGAVISAPAFTLHGFDNTGTETLKLVGFFGANVLVTSFDEPVAPFGSPSFVTPIQ